jgi:hypothetical protein
MLGTCSLNLGTCLLMLGRLASGKRVDEITLSISCHSMRVYILVDELSLYKLVDELSLYMGL